MTDWTQQTATARQWFETLRDRICAEFEAIEREAGSEAGFDYIAWDRDTDDGSDGGGGVRGVMKGKVFEKVGVNVSTVTGTFAPQFAATINGADEDNPGFTATGISLVAHMANPHVPAVHMNTRFLTTQAAWFGGGADLNPPIEYAEDTESFHARLRAACSAHNPTYYDRFSKWAEEYFFIPHRGRARGVGGVFMDDRNSGDWEADFALTQDIGRAFLPAYLPIIETRRGMDWGDPERDTQLIHRGLYAEYNLVYDRGTKFGLATGHDANAVLMSLPPLAKWV